MPLRPPPVDQTAYNRCVIRLNYTTDAACFASSFFGFLPPFLPFSGRGGPAAGRAGPGARGPGGSGPPSGPEPARATKAPARPARPEAPAGCGPPEPPQTRPAPCTTAGCPHRCSRRRSSAKKAAASPPGPRPAEKPTAPWPGPGRAAPPPAPPDRGSRRSRAPPARGPAPGPSAQQAAQQAARGAGLGILQPVDAARKPGLAPLQVQGGDAQLPARKVQHTVPQRKHRAVRVAPDHPAHPGDGQPAAGLQDQVVRRGFGRPAGLFFHWLASPLSFATNRLCGGAGGLFRRALRDDLVHLPGHVLGAGLGVREDPHLDRAVAKGDLDHVPGGDGGAGLGHLAVDEDAAGVGHLVGHRPPLDEAGHFQIFIQTHKWSSFDTQKAAGRPHGADPSGSHSLVPTSSRPAPGGPGIRGSLSAPCPA